MRHMSSRKEILLNFYLRFMPGASLSLSKDWGEVSPSTYCGFSKIPPCISQFSTRQKGFFDSFLSAVVHFVSPLVMARSQI